MVHLPVAEGEAGPNLLKISELAFATGIAVSVASGTHGLGFNEV
jgi:hypothetical protein